MVDAPVEISAQEKEERDARLNCRYFEQQFPEVDECVMVEIKQVDKTLGVYVQLLEYNNIEGMIQLSELSRRRYRSINKLVTVGKLETVMVMRVDEDKGYIDLSKRRVAKEDIAKCEERYNKAKLVNSIMRNLAETTGSNLLDLNQKITWPLSKPPYKSAYEAFQIAIQEPERVFGNCDVDKDIIERLLTVIRRKLTPQALRIRADIEVFCLNSAGIEAIKEALLAGESVGTEEIPIKVKLIASPKYVILATSIVKKDGLDLMAQSIEKIRETILAHKGDLRVLEEPHVTSNEEENLLKQELEGGDGEEDDDDDESDEAEE